MTDTDNLLELTNVFKHYDSPDGSQTPDVLKDITLQLSAGASLAVVGASGSGKSTLLNIIGTLDRPTRGSVRLAGRDLAQLDDKELSQVRNQQIGFVFQLHHLLNQCTVLENVLVPTLLNKDLTARQELQQRARQLLDRVGLQDRLTYRPGQLSGGERQRVAVVRALINKPKLLLADEPTGSLDDAASDNLTNLLVELNREEGVTLIVVTHALKVAQRMQLALELIDGTLKPLEKQT